MNAVGQISQHQAVIVLVGAAALALLAAVLLLRARAKSNAPIAVERDRIGLRRAAFELLEAAAFAGLDAEESAGREKADLGLFEDRRLPHGYYLWLNYIFKEIEAPFKKRGISAEEILRQIKTKELLVTDEEERIGLIAVSEARVVFGRRHPLCQRCRRSLRKAWDKHCGECKAAMAAVAGARG